MTCAGYFRAAGIFVRQGIQRGLQRQNATSLKHQISLNGQSSAPRYVMVMTDGNRLGKFKLKEMSTGEETTSALKTR